MSNLPVGNLQGRTVNVVDGARTPFLKVMNKPGPFTASDLAVHCGSTLLSRQPFPADAFDEVIVGCIAPGVDEANIARIIALRLGCGKSMPAYSVQRNCASGMQSLDNAALDIATGRADLVLAGGTEAMSYSPIVYNKQMATWLGELGGARSLLTKLITITKLRPSMLKPVIGLLRGLTDPFTGLSMGQTAENLAHRFKISREQMDNYAIRSHENLARALDNHLLDEIVELIDTSGTVYTEDNGLRRESSIEKLAMLSPVFDRKFGHITAANSAQITDGAALLILASDDAVAKYSLPVLGRITDVQWAGLDPVHMGLGPVHAATPILQRHQYGLDEIDYWEINEAFAAQVLACIAAWKDSDYCINELGLAEPLGELGLSRLNIDGGGVSLGHPVGASGARIVLHALKVLERNNEKRAIATLCIGGGQGGAMLLERQG
ncbi:MAG: acetyl-CoA C-acetyltransferase [Gammaproteobacteria bacterium]|nr:acetyl-CoA C-acetyltransferase [Gammaproteobacteria bacterium]